jgi:hypothetical protein
VIKFLFLIFCAVNAFAEFEYKAEIAFESRGFRNDNDDATEDYGMAIAPRFDIKHNQDSWVTKLRVFGRNDTLDDRRRIIFLEDAYTGLEYDTWQVHVGWKILNWSATEAFHPADILNARNFDSSLENAEKIGELMVHYTYILEEGTINFFYLPYIMLPNLPEPNNRLSFFPSNAIVGNSLIVDESGNTLANKWQPQWAFRFEYTLGDADISFYALEHFDRYQPNILPSAGPTFTSTFYKKFQYGFTYQHAIGSSVFKLETATIDFYDSGAPSTSKQMDHTQIAFGIDYINSHKDGSESTLIFEGQFIPDVGKSSRAALQIFQRDLLIGYRYALNDTNSKEFFASLIFDIERGRELLASISYSQRLSDTWKLNTGYRYIDAPQKGLLASGLEPLDKDNQLSLTITRFF